MRAVVGLETPPVGAGGLQATGGDFGDGLLRIGGEWGVVGAEGGGDQQSEGEEEWRGESHEWSPSQLENLSRFCVAMNAMNIDERSEWYATRP